MDLKQIDLAYRNWLYRVYPFREQENILAPFLDDDITPFRKGQSWLRIARTSLMAPAAAISEKLKISRSAYYQKELAEQNGTITLNALSEAAQAMDCELVYAIRPKQKLLFSQVIWKVLQKTAMAHRYVKAIPDTRKSGALSAVARWKTEDPKFRKEQGWCQRQTKRKRF